MSSERQHESWVAAACSGDRLALAKLLTLHHPTLAGRVAARLDPVLRGRISPEDLLQEVYLQVFRQIGEFEDRGPESFRRWIITILDHKLIDARRAAHRQRRDVERESPPPAVERTNSYWNLLDQVYCDPGTPSRIVRRDEAIGALLSCISGLAEAQRRVIELRFMEGLPVAEVARRVGKSEDAVVALTQRGLKSLRAAMDRLGEYTRGG